MGDFGEGKMIRLENVIGQRSDDTDLRKIDDELKFTQVPSSGITCAQASNVGTVAAMYHVWV